MAEAIVLKAPPKSGIRANEIKNNMALSLFRLKHVAQGKKASDAEVLDFLKKQVDSLRTQVLPLYSSDLYQTREANVRHDREVDYRAWDKWEKYNLRKVKGQSRLCLRLADLCNRISSMASGSEKEEYGKMAKTFAANAKDMQDLGSRHTGKWEFAGSFDNDEWG